MASGLPDSLPKCNWTFSVRFWYNKIHEWNVSSWSPKWRSSWNACLRLAIILNHGRLEKGRLIYMGRCGSGTGLLDRVSLSLPSPRSTHQTIVIAGICPPKSKICSFKKAFFRSWGSVHQEKFKNTSKIYRLFKIITACRKASGSMDETFLRTFGEDELWRILSLLNIIH